MTSPNAMLDTLAGLVFWVSAASLAYGYVGYPMLMYVLSRLRRRSAIRKEIHPRVTLLVPAYNEERAIQAKIQNCRQLDYPKDRLEVLVASDGSTDATGGLIQAATDAGLIRGVVFRTRRGKAAVLNDLVDMASGEILVVSDATSLLEPGSLRALVSNFADPGVGCVSGIYRIVGGEEDGKAGPEALYWRYETFIRDSESRLGAMLGAHGSMFGVRRELFERLEVGTRNEDFLIPVTALLKGYRSVYDTRAVAREDAAEMTGFSRRISLATGNFQQMALLLKRRGWRGKPFLVFQLLSHKVLRLLSPLLILAAYASSAGLLASPGFRIAFAAQTAFFITALLGLHPELRRRGRVLVAAPYYFCMVNAAGLVALRRVVSGRGPVSHRAGANARDMATRTESPLAR